MQAKIISVIMTIIIIIKIIMIIIIKNEMISKVQTCFYLRTNMSRILSHRLFA